jgi:hypothetical protein
MLFLFFILLKNPPVLLYIDGFESICFFFNADNSSRLAAVPAFVVRQLGKLFKSSTKNK